MAACSLAIGQSEDSERELNPMSLTCSLARSFRARFSKPQVKMRRMCPRSESQLTYMIDIALTTELVITAGGAR